MKERKPPKNRKHAPKVVIGRRDRVDFPDLSLTDIDAKVDTGAFSCAMHCNDMKIFQRKDEPWVRFSLYEDALQVKHSARILQYKNIKNSFGQKEQRCIIQTRIRLFGADHWVDVALTNRETMKNPVLLGRKLLMDRFVVDVSKVNLSYKLKLANKSKGR
ncbi:MAG TPA: RimK/LysX family protein [Chitinophagales bacterium]|nr:RimK/LysX family protein [Chitinophagales bacterium]